jgi:periplasmic serine protease
MAGWSDIMEELQKQPSNFDIIRRKYLLELSEYTGRNTIAYYSAWLNKKGVDNTDINDTDMNGYMNAVKGLDTTKGLDLILHTPGGDPAAAESIVKYLRSKFNNDIRVIVPHLAMSAGTMMACAAKEIIMGRHSSLGPIDPQFSGIPAYDIKLEFEEAKKDLVEHPENFRYWQIKLQQFPAAFLKTAIDAIELADILVKEWLTSCMFLGEDIDDGKIETIVKTLNDHADSKTHGRHFDAVFCRNIGLKIINMEDDQELQDKILSVHHSYVQTLTATSTVKIIENQEGKCMINHI